MRIDIVSVFPEYFDVLNLSLLGKAQAKGLIDVHAHNLRDWTHDVHHAVDDTPVGGGAGMVMKPAVWAECLDDLLGLEPRDMSGQADTASSDMSASVAEGADTGDMLGRCRNQSGDIDDAGRGQSGANQPVAVASADDPSSAASGYGNTDMPVGGFTTADDKSDAPQSSNEEPAIHRNADSVDSAEQSEHVNDNSEHVNGGSATVLIFPNPSAPLFTQRDATKLSHARRLVFGCGRYEGYDARIPEYYRAQGVDVREYSIGDYVLNGGEVAVSVMLEAITRLLPGFMGNPESIVEESYTGGNALLEHRQYTKPAVWRGMGVPEILLSGDHGKVDRFRRDEALTRTNQIRPDLIERLDCRTLTKADRKTLMALGWEVSGARPRRIAPPSA